MYERNTDSNGIPNGSKPHFALSAALTRHRTDLTKPPSSGWNSQTGAHAPSLSLVFACIGLHPEVEATIGDSFGNSPISIRNFQTIDEALLQPGALSFVLIDIWTESNAGIENLRRIRTACRHPAVMVCTNRSDKAGVLLGLGAGANGYLINPFSHRQLLDGVEAVLGGANFLCPRAQHLLASALHQWGKSSRHLLSTREDQIMSCILAGLSDKAIAMELSISASTVHAHIAKVFAKLGVGSREAAIQRYWQLQ